MVENTIGWIFSLEMHLLFVEESEYPLQYRYTWFENYNDHLVYILSNDNQIEISFNHLSFIYK